MFLILFSLNKKLNRNQRESWSQQREGYDERMRHDSPFDDEYTSENYEEFIFSFCRTLLCFDLTIHYV
jgi:hypothetical protein